MPIVNELELVDRAAAFLRQRLGPAATTLRLGLVLGSGLKGFAKEVQEATVVPFAEIPGWPVPHVEGHGGALVVGTVAGTPVACLSGRVHLYEGWHPGEVVRAVRTLRRLGTPSFLLTNAAGGIADDMTAGDLMVLRDHLNLTGQSPLVGPHEPVFGPRFPDQTRVYAPRLQQLLVATGARLRPGVYAGLLGPSYETPAEIRMLQRLGAQAVGMSTVPETILARHAGLRVLALSLLTNMAAGLSTEKLSHAHTLASAAAASELAVAQLSAIVREMEV